MEIRPIHTEADYKATLREVSALMESDPALGTPDGDRLDVLTTLIQAYEAKHHPIDPPDPIDAIRFRMEQAGLTVKDLEPMIGKSNRVYGVFSRKRPLTLAMMMAPAPPSGYSSRGTDCRERDWITPESSPKPSLAGAAYHGARYGAIVVRGGRPV